MRDQLAEYRDIDRASLRDHLVFFLRMISPVADELGIRLAIHPDDPPFDILGLPESSVLQPMLILYYHQCQIKVMEYAFVRVRWEPEIIMIS